MVEFTQRPPRQSHLVRELSWAKTEGAKPEEWNQMAPFYRAKLWDEVIGGLPASQIPLNPKTRNTYHGAKWEGCEVNYGVAPSVFHLHPLT